MGDDIPVGPDCAVCQQPIIGQVTQALGKNYHPDHFVYRVALLYIVSYTQIVAILPLLSHILSLCVSHAYLSPSTKPLRHS